jgi:chromosome segregation ATPase
VCKDNTRCKPLHSFMDIQTLTTEQFKSVKELADMSIKISEAREELLNLQNTKTQYIEAREKETTEKIKALFDKSEDLVDKIKFNNHEIHTLFTLVSSYKDFLVEGHSKLKELIADFEERGKLWEKKVEDYSLEVGEIENKIKKDRKDIENSKKEIEKEMEHIRREKVKIADDRETIKRSIERLKANKK